jgi:two-component system, OmpR family, osmolarity sensor histidine kinase EnvZ
MFFHWLKHYLPRGLYGRAALILLLPVVVLQLVISINFIQRHFEGVTRQMTQSVLVELRYLVETVAAADGPGAAQVAALALGDPLELDVALPAATSPASDNRQFFDLSGRVVIATLRDGLPDLRAVDLVADRRRVHLWLDMPQGVMQVSFDRRRVSASNPHQLLVLMVVLSVLMTLIAFIFLRNQLRPIKRMAEAATEYGKGRSVPYTPSGAAEVRAAGTAFLDMRNRIERQTQQRTMMLSGVSHDLRTPLTRLRLGLSMIDEADAAPLLRDVDDMQRLVDSFLDFARDDALDTAITCDPMALVRGIVEDAQRAGQAASIREPEGKLPQDKVKLRPMAIRRALDNLIGNALRYGTCAEVSLSFSDRTLRITVEDDGPGIAPGQREESMRPFSRLDPSRNQDRGSGVGLGLAIVSDIARAHGGLLRLGQSERLGGLRADLLLAR